MSNLEENYVLLHIDNYYYREQILYSIINYVFYRCVLVGFNLLQVSSIGFILFESASIIRSNLFCSFEAALICFYSFYPVVLARRYSF